MNGLHNPTEICITNTKLYNTAYVVKLFNLLYEEVKHGDDEHQKWLHDKIQDFVAQNVK